MLEQVRNEAKAAALEICQVAKLRKGQILVVGCSTSEVTGHKVGSYSSPELGQAIYEGIQEALQPQGIYLAAQCCEHLNRAIISATAEIQIQVIDGEIGREFSDEIGLNLFKF